MSEYMYTVEAADSLLEPVVEFPGIEDAVFQRLQPLTDYRKDDAEARILYICRRNRFKGQHAEDKVETDDQGDLFVLKCKIQAPSKLAGGLTEPIEGPSEHTTDELKALKVFTETDSIGLPHLLAWKKTIQGPDGPMPGGYIAYVLMTMMPGQHLLDLKFWSMTEEEREAIRELFLPAVKHVWSLGFEPYDCALRNVLWVPETKSISLVDFEHWHPTSKDPAEMDEEKEMQRWGLKHRPPPALHWQEWFLSEGLTRKQ